MKYIFTLLIVVVSLFFSSVFSASAQEGYLEQLLQLSTGLESSQMDEIPKLPARAFSNASVQKTYDEFLKLDTLLRSEFVKQYQNGDISYYQMQDLIANYSDFLYYTGKTFSYVSEHEK